MCQKRWPMQAMEQRTGRLEHEVADLQQQLRLALDQALCQDDGVEHVECGYDHLEDLGRMV